MRTSGTCAWLIWLSIALLGECALADVLTTKSGSQYEGTVTEDGNSYNVVKPDGGKMTWPKSMVSRIEKGAVLPAAATTPLKSPLAPPTGGGPVKGVGGEDNGRIMEVVATGAGSTPDEAVQSAYSAAIEQVVGVLVDAETLVKNDQIVSDKVRTFSRGFVNSYEEVKRWDSGGIHYVRIRAKVAVDRLSDSLKSSKVSTREVPGKFIAPQIRFDAKNEKEAAEMLAKSLAAFDITNMTKVEIVGEPKITKDGAMAKMLITATIAPDMDKWAKFSQQIRPLLAKAALSRATAEVDTSGSIRSPEIHGALEKQLKVTEDDDGLVGLFAGVKVKGDAKRTQWEVFHIPVTMKEPLREASDKRYRLRYALLDGHDSIILESGHPLVSSFGDHLFWTPLTQNQDGWQRVFVWWVGPVWWMHAPAQKSLATLTVEHSLSLSIEDLQKMVKVAASLEEDKKK